MNPGNALIKYSSHQTHFSARYPKLPHPWCPHIARNSDIVARNYVISAHRCFGRRDGKSLHHWCSQFYMYYPPSVLNKIVMGFVVFLCPPRVRESPEPQYLSEEFWGMQADRWEENLIWLLSVYQGLMTGTLIAHKCSTISTFPQASPATWNIPPRHFYEKWLQHFGSKF